MEITITEDDIRDGVPRCATACPAARAITRATGWAEVMVCGRQVGWRTGAAGMPRLLYRMRLPPALAEWVWRYDRGDKMQPLTFELPEAV